MNANVSLYRCAWLLCCWHFLCVQVKRQRFKIGLFVTVLFVLVNKWRSHANYITELVNYDKTTNVRKRHRRLPGRVTSRDSITALAAQVLSIINYCTIAHYLCLYVSSVFVPSETMSCFTWYTSILTALLYILRTLHSGTWPLNHISLSPFKNFIVSNSVMTRTTLNMQTFIP